MTGVRYPHTAIVLGLSPAGLYLVRDLSAAGIMVYGVTDRGESGIVSRYLHGSKQRWSQLSDAELLEHIGEFSEGGGAAPVLLPANDRFIAWISAQYERLKPISCFSTSYHPVRCTQLLDKDEFYRVCEETAVPYPRRVPLAEHSADEIADNLGLPVLIKPARMYEVAAIMGVRKAFVCRRLEELESYRKRLPRSRGGWLAQEIVIGPENDIYCLGGVRAGNGEIVAPVSARKIRQFPSGYGTATALRMEPAPRELWEHTRTLLDALDLDGLFEIEFKRDQKDGLWKVFEINPRTALWFGTARVAGIPLALAAYCVHANSETDLIEGEGATIHLENRKAVNPGYTAGHEAGRETSEPPLSTVVWRAGLKNLVSIGLQLLRKGSLRLLVAEPPWNPRGNRSAWAFWEAGDPMPAMKEFLGIFTKLAGRVLRRMFRKSAVDG
jgi:D-aspartate ligase